MVETGAAMKLFEEKSCRNFTECLSDVVFRKQLTCHRIYMLLYPQGIILEPIVEYVSISCQKHAIYNYC